MSISTFMFVANVFVLFVYLCACIVLGLSKTKYKCAVISVVSIMTITLLIGFNKPKSNGGHGVNCGCWADGIPARLKIQKNNLLRYATKHYPHAQILSSEDTRKMLEGIPYINHEIKKYAFHTTKEAWWLGYDTTDLHQKVYSIDIPPYTFREKVLDFFNIEQDLRRNIRQQIRAIAEYYSQESSRPTLFLGSDALDHPPLSDDLNNLYQTQHNVLWIRVR